VPLQIWLIQRFILNCFQHRAIIDLSRSEVFPGGARMNKNDCLLPRVAIWLVPRQPERDILQAVIAALADRFSAPEFVPHATIYSCRRSTPQTELAVTAALARHCPPLTLRTAGMTFTDRLTRAFFVRLSSGKTLQWLRKALQTELRQTSIEDFEPHLSLLYQVLPVSDRTQLIEKIRLPFDEIVFDQIWAVAIPETLNATENLTGWQTLLHCRLDSSAITDKIQEVRPRKMTNQEDDNGRQD
jgi:hypothetical protein